MKVRVKDEGFDEMKGQKRRPRGRPKLLFGESSAGTLQSLDRALIVLVAIAQAGRLTLTDLSAAVDVPTATTHRILTTLKIREFVTFDEERQDWSIGIEAFRTGASFLNHSNLMEVARPILQRLMEQTGETANLAIRQDAEVVFVGQVETQNPVRALFPSGTRTAMHASGIGKAILAELPKSQAENLLRAVDSFPENAGLDRVFDELTVTRKRGYSIDREGHHVGMSCVGSAIFDEYGVPCAGVSISGPSARFNDRSIVSFGAAVNEAALEITRGKGGRVPV